MTRIPKPICAVCRREVERMESNQNPCTMAITFRVYCHGQQEEAVLSDFDRMVADKIEPGLAFLPMVALTEAAN